MTDRNQKSRKKARAFRLATIGFLFLVFDTSEKCVLKFVFQNVQISFAGPNKFSENVVTVLLR